jgi:hypothetical protein
LQAGSELFRIRLARAAEGKAFIFQVNLRMVNLTSRAQPGHERLGCNI